jgi:hypothetical protein
MRTIILLTVIIIFFWNGKTHGQIAVNNDGSSADPTAVLDLQSTDKGFLLPRIDYNDRPDPAATGLMIFVTSNGPLGDNALYIYDGTNWNKLLMQPATIIGTEMEGGIVFYHDTDQGFGLVSAEADEGYAEYGCFGTLIGPDGQHTEIGFGEVNTAAVLVECTDPGIAADLCDQLELNGYDDWFLPSLDELREMYTYRNEIGGFISTLYWSSAESEFATPVEEAAWIVNFDDGGYGWTAKSGNLPVRCIRKYYIAVE